MIFISEINNIKVIVDNLYTDYKSYNPFVICKSLNITVSKCSFNGNNVIHYKLFNYNHIVLNSSLTNYEELYYLAFILGHILLSKSKMIPFKTAKYTGLLNSKTDINSLFATNLLLNYYQQVENYDYSVLSSSMIAKLTDIPYFFIKTYFENS